MSGNQVAATQPAHDAGDDEDLIRLLISSGRVVGRHLDQRLQMRGSSATEFLILSRVDSEPGISQRDLAAGIGIEAPSLVPHIDRLEHDGRICRGGRPGDRRVCSIRLMPAGASRLVDLQAETGRASAELAALFSPGEAAVLHAYLVRLGAFGGGTGEEVAPVDNARRRGGRRPDDSTGALLPSSSQ